MSTHKGFILRRSGAVSVHDSVSLDGLVTWQGGVRLAAVKSPLSGLATPGVRRPITSSVPGYIVPDYFLRFYNQIHILPATVALGNFTTKQTVSFTVWNAFLTSKYLERVELIADESVTLSGINAPVTFNKLATKEWVLTVEGSGAAQVNCEVVFYFTGLEPVRFILTGSRSQAWTFTPDWSNDITETLEWKTDVLNSRTGAEQRIARRLSPRRTFEFRILAQGIERQRFERLLRNNGAQVWQLPIFNDVGYTLADAVTGDNTLSLNTEGREMSVGDKLMLINNAKTVSESATITATNGNEITLTGGLNNDWSAGSVYYPVKNARLTDTPRITRIHDDALSVTVRFQITEHNAYSDRHGLALHRGFPVLEPASSWSEDLTAEYSRLTDTVDNSYGIPSITDTAGRPFSLQSHLWIAGSRGEQSALRRIFYWLRGRQRAIWIPGNSTEFYLYADVNGQFIDVVKNGFADDGLQPGAQDIRIELTGGRIYYRRIMAVNSGDEFDRLAVDGDTLTFAQHEVMKISFLRLCRMGSDSVVWQHKTDSDGAALISANFKEVRDELE